MFKTSGMNFDLKIQRNENIWDHRRQSLFIHSVLADYPVPPVYSIKDEKVLSFIDGKQRLSAIFFFIANKLPLHKDTPPINDIQIAGLKFEDLPEGLKGKLLGRKMEVTRIENVNEDEIKNLFSRLNNGVPLRQIESTRAVLGTSILKHIEDIANTNFFTSRVNISPKAKTRFVDQEVILQIMTLLLNSETGFSGKELRTFAETMKDNDIREDLVAKIKSACFFLYDAFEGKEVFLKKMHLPMLFNLVFSIKQDERYINVTSNIFSMFAKEFFNDLPSEYTEACFSGSAKKENVQKRIAIVNKAFDDFYKRYRDNDSEAVS